MRFQLGKIGVLAAAFVTLAHAQVNSATLLGTVRDSSEQPYRKLPLP